MPQSTILITNCFSDSALLIARHLQLKQWRVFVSSANPYHVEQLKLLGFEAVQLDLRHSDSIFMALNWTLERCEHQLDAVLHGPLMLHSTGVEHLSRTQLMDELNRGLIGWHEMNTIVLRLMRRRGKGRIIMPDLFLAHLPYHHLGVNALHFCGARELSKIMINEMTANPLQQWRDVFLIHLEMYVRNNGFGDQPGEGNYEICRQIQFYQGDKNTLPDLEQRLLAALQQALEAPHPHLQYPLYPFARRAYHLSQCLPQSWGLSIQRRLVKRYAHLCP